MFCMTFMKLQFRLVVCLILNLNLRLVKLQIFKLTSIFYFFQELSSFVF